MVTQHIHMVYFEMKVFHGDRYWSEKKEGFLSLIIYFSFFSLAGGGGDGESLT